MTGRALTIYQRGFTIVEIMIVVVIIGILATISIIAYNGVQRRAAQTAVQSDLKQAEGSLEVYRQRSNGYPTTAEGISVLDFNATNNVTTTYKGPSAGGSSYGVLDSKQNALLFKTLCSATMPMKSPDGTVTYATNCPHYDTGGLNLSGGTHGAYLGSPIQATFQVSDCTTCTDSYYVPYNSVAETFRTTLINTFIAQGGTFPVVMYAPWEGEPTLPTPTATEGYDYCIESRSITYSDIIWSIRAGQAQKTGVC